jgi:outer membrane protein OmpA-like peptidoglycan-associated protein
MSRVTARGQAGRRGSEGDDRAFWISYSDLMTALMVLFMMVMAVALMAVKRPEPRESTRSARTLEPRPHSAAAAASTPPGEAQALAQLAREIAEVAQATPGVHFDARRLVVDFGDRARFATGSHKLDADSARLLREFVPQLLAIARKEPMHDWVQRIVVEGFADPRGDYLFNLNLSLQRAQRVLCALLEPTTDGSALSVEQRTQVRDIFSVGGFSFNDQRDSMDASRRIELRVEFGPRPSTAGAPAGELGSCRLPA